MDPLYPVLNEPYGDSSEDDLMMGHSPDPDDGDSDQSSPDSKKRKRGSYRCSRCGLPKKGHNCPDNFDGVHFAIVDSPNPRLSSSTSIPLPPPSKYNSGIVPPGSLSPHRLDDKPKEMLIHHITVLRDENILLRQELARLTELLHVHRINPMAPLAMSGGDHSNARPSTAPAGLMPPHHHHHHSHQLPQQQQPPHASHQLLPPGQQRMPNLGPFPNGLHNSSNIPNTPNGLLPSGAPLLPPSAMSTLPSHLNSSGGMPPFRAPLLPNIATSTTTASSNTNSANTTTSASSFHVQPSLQQQQQQQQQQQLLPLNMTSTSEAFTHHTSSSSSNHHVQSNQVSTAVFSESGLPPPAKRMALPSKADPSSAVFSSHPGAQHHHQQPSLHHQMSHPTYGGSTGEAPDALPVRSRTFFQPQYNLPVISVGEDSSSSYDYDRIE